MSEQDKPATGAPEQAPAAPAEAPAAGSQPDNQTPPQAPEAKPAEEAKPAASPESGAPDKPQDQAQESKPQVRRSAQYRIQQLASERDEWKAKYEAATKAQNDQDRGEPNPDDIQQQPQPDISNQVSKEVERRLEPVLSEHRQTADNQEINELFSGELAAKRAVYEPKIREAWKLDQYKDLAARDILRILDYDAALRQAKQQAIEEFKKAEKEAQESSGSGSNNISNRSGSGGKSVDQMTDEELVEHNNRVKAGQA
jgi:hypothetical protein